MHHVKLFSRRYRVSNISHRQIMKTRWGGKLCASGISKNSIEQSFSPPEYVTITLTALQRFNYSSIQSVAFVNLIAGTELRKELRLLAFDLNLCLHYNSIHALLAYCQFKLLQSSNELKKHTTCIVSRRNLRVPLTASAPLFSLLLPATFIFCIYRSLPIFNCYAISLLLMYIDASLQSINFSPSPCNPT